MNRCAKEGECKSTISERREFNLCVDSSSSVYPSGSLSETHISFNSFLFIYMYASILFKLIGVFHALLNFRLCFYSFVCEFYTETVSLCILMAVIGDSYLSSSSKLTSWFGFELCGARRFLFHFFGVEIA